jgi:hypothetical protein
MRIQLFLLAAFTIVLGGCMADTGDTEGLSSTLRTMAAPQCSSCPACAASMVCFDGASLACGSAPELYSPIACVRPDGTRHGQYKEFEWIEDRWIETDGWYVDGVPVGRWVSVDATDMIVKVVAYVEGEPQPMRLE